MSEKLLDILKQKGECIPEELLIRYAEGKTSADEARRVEDHVSECEFCSDALDGIMQGENVRHFHSDISSIKKIVRKKMRGSDSSATFPITRMLAIAATLLLLAISAWYVQYLVNDNSEKIFSNQFKPYPVPQMEDKSQSPAPAANESKVEMDSQKKSSPKKFLPVSKSASPNSVPQQEEKKESEKDVAEPSLKQPETVEQPSFAGTSKNADDAPQEDVSSLKINTDSTIASPSSYSYSTAPSQTVVVTQGSAAYSQDEIMTDAKKDSYQKEVIIDNFNKAMALYQSNHYEEAIAEFQLVLQKEPGNPAANFYSGVSTLALKNPDEALKYFKKTDYKSCQYYEASLWYEALSYISKEDKKQARKLLEKVVELNGEYKVKAKETLKQL
ncbi:MAG TPA: tetratricopeptide repeat protein [Chitinophagales bacterium]|nr:tetratricopeptide repeat protein [Chitinophagales bacterium]